MQRVSVVNYGIGNLLSVQRAFEKIGCTVELITKSSDILQAECLVLPGVGAFGDGMSELSRRGMVAPIKEYCDLGRPFLGICLGMQMMLESSDESEEAEGIGIIEGKVSRLTELSIDSLTYKVPNIGWYSLSGRAWEDTILDGITNMEQFYFVHSYAAYPKWKESSLAEVDYGSQTFSAAIHKGNCYGTQFHPEKSGEAGLMVLRNFISKIK